MLRVSLGLTAAVGGVALMSWKGWNLKQETIKPAVASIKPVFCNYSPQGLDQVYTPAVAADNGPELRGPNIDYTDFFPVAEDGDVEAVEEDGQDGEFQLFEVDVVRPNEQGRQQVEADKLKAAITKARDLCWCKMYEAGTPGMVVAIAVNGKMVWQHGFGYSDVENKLLAGTGCVMRIASISKPITMAALAKLYEEGRVDLDENVSKYVKDWPEDGEKGEITVRQLCSHLSGVRHYEKKKSDKADDSENKEEFEQKEYYIKEKFDTTAASLDLFKTDELLSKPGTAFHYTTHGFTLLAAVIESVTGEKFDQFMKKQFKVLGLNNTYLDDAETLIYNRARYYVRDKHHRLKNAPYVDCSYKWAGGGLLSNVSDLVKFGNAMLYSYQYKGHQHKKQNQKILETNIPTVPVVPAPPVNKELEEEANTGPEEKISPPIEEEMEKKIDPEKINPDDIKVKNASDEVLMNRNVVYHPGPLAAVNKTPEGGAAVLPGYLSSKTVAELWTPQDNTALTWGGDDLAYGLGWAVVPPGQKKYAFGRDQYQYIAHTGGAIGASSVLLIAPKKVGGGDTRLPQGVVVAILTNMQEVGLSKLAVDIAQVFQGISTEKPARVQKVYQC